MTAWLTVALFGTAYLFFISSIALLAFRRRRQPWLLAVAFATGIVHQIGFWNDLIFDLPSITEPSDPFHATAILWNGGAVDFKEMMVDWSAAISGWGLLIVAVSLLYSFAVSVWLAWGIASCIPDRLCSRRFSLPFGDRLMVKCLVCLVAWLFSVGASATVSEVYVAITPPLSHEPLVIWPAPELFVAGWALIAVPVLAFFMPWRKWRPAPARR